MGSKDTRRLARAFERAEVRHQVTDPGAELSFDALIRGALIEVRVDADLRRAREHRRIRKAVRRLAAADDLLARLPVVEAAAWAGADPGEGRAGPGPPPWHPESLNPENL